ncbi:unnamed protein product, partial [Symbiodinium pilosum]
INTGSYLGLMFKVRESTSYGTLSRLLEVLASASMGALLLVAYLHNRLVWSIQHKFVNALVIVASMRNFTRQGKPSIAFDSVSFEQLKFPGAFPLPSNFIAIALQDALVEAEVVDASAEGDDVGDSRPRPRKKKPKLEFMLRTADPEELINAQNCLKGCTERLRGATPTLPSAKSMEPLCQRETE